MPQLAFAPGNVILRRMRFRKSILILVVLGLFGGVPERARAALECPDLAEVERFYDPISSNREALARDGITLAKLEASFYLGGSSGARLYITAEGRKFVVKGGHPGEEEAVYLMSRRTGLRVVPKTERLTIEGKEYSAQVYVADMPGWARVPGDRPLPNDKLMLLDALFGNIDRGYSRVADQYAAYANDKGETIQLSYDHGAMQYGLLDSWARAYDGFGAENRRPSNLAIIVSIIRRNPEFVRRLRAWTPAEMTRELSPLVDDEYLSWILKKREDILRYADEAPPASAPGA